MLLDMLDRISFATIVVDLGGLHMWRHGNKKYFGSKRV